MAVVNTRRWRERRRYERRRMMVIGAHSADFVWRAGGAIAVTTADGGDGERDRALLRRARRVGRAVEGAGPDDRARQGDPPRRGRAGSRTRSAPSSRCLDLGDYPLEIDAGALTRIADAIREFAPDVLITHTDTDPFNPDHPVAFAAVDAGPRRSRPAPASRARSRRSRRRSCSCSSRTSPSCATSRRRRSSTSRR